MGRFLLNLIVNGFAIWVTTLIVAGVNVTPYAPGGTLETILTFALVALIFAVVNTIIGSVIKVLAFPLYILTLGLIGLLINGLLLLITAGISGWFGFGLTVDGFWWGVLGAIVISIVNWLLGIVIRPKTKD
ncbi:MULTISPECIES: phage holin family protein [Plantibacter]|jgi:putative membrane protein|uniref:phage holin family protein n=1 Tax=Plantibacter TaxID=190323 RepID=UPI001780D076|nr:MULTISPECIES: phage holin family protein [Plantibacter]MBD8100780.1 phage holin family protein [Plantibacter sp. CFBP 8775]MBD8518375.1 phage holin family protein [Plantibacter sp. CFBP 8804]MBD8536917.1 phage holin family protein [Plantibacter sp. CFBP 13570]MDD9150955.1 phage holin family protein [Plantibacter flavus]